MAGDLVGRHKLRIGESFSPSSKHQYYSLRYDFKPASIDPNSPSNLIITGNEVTVIPDGEKPQTVFRGNKRPCQKEGILIFDPSTGDCTLERLSNILQVKKSRDATPHVLPPLATESSLDSSPKHNPADRKTFGNSKHGEKRVQSNIAKKTSPGQQSSSVTKLPPQPRLPVPSRLAKDFLREDLNLSESDDD